MKSAEAEISRLSAITMDRRISWLRVAACFMVVLLHVSAMNIHTFDEKWWSANFFDSLSRACVPLFFMIAGATLLSKIEPLGAFFKKRFIRIIPPLLFWSLFYLATSRDHGASAGNWIVAILSGPTMFHLWYFYAVIGLYAFIPLLRKVYQNSTRKEQAWFIAIWFIVAALYPTAQRIYLNKPQCFDAGPDVLANTYYSTYFSGYVGYLLLGAFIAAGNGSIRKGLAIFVASSAGTMVATYIISRHLGEPCEFFYTYLSPMVLTAAAGLFLAFMGLPSGEPSKVCTALSDCTLGIYGIHPFIIGLLVLYPDAWAKTGSNWIRIPLLAACTFAASFGIIYIARRFKPLRYVT